MHKVLPGSGSAASIGALTPEIIERADEIESIRKIPKDLVDKLQAAGAYKMMIPRKYGGLELSYIEASETLERLAYADASTAWSSMVSIGHNFTLGAFSSKLIDRLYSENTDVLTRGGMAPSCTAVRTDGGFIVQGRLPLASGCYEHQWAIGVAVVRDGEGQPVRLPDGSPKTIVFLAPREKTEVLPTWDALGLRGSCSDDIAVPEQFIGLDYTATPPSMVSSWESSFDTPNNSAPVLVTLPPDHASVALGIASGALDDLMALSNSKRPAFGAGKKLAEDLHFAPRFGHLAVRLDSARSYLRHFVSENARIATEGAHLFSPLRAIQTASMAVYVQNECIAIVDQAFTLAGVDACYNKSRIQRRMRDIRCLGQHIAARTAPYDEFARLLGEAGH